MDLGNRIYIKGFFFSYPYFRLKKTLRLNHLLNINIKSPLWALLGKSYCDNKKMDWIRPEGEEKRLSFQII